MPFKPVDTAIKIIVGPCIDDTDMKTREEGLTYDQAGMEIDVILEKADGTVTTTAVTPTTAGVHDWAHTDQGYYELEIPATGGNYANDEEGQITVVGYATGVLPFRSVAYDVVPTNVYNALVRGTDKMEVDTVELSGDSTAADNAESAFDGTGYAFTNSTIPTVTTLTNKTGFSLAADQSAVTVGAVTGAVGSVTGNVGGNVSGSAGSVAGAVGSVTGNVGGSVASVTAKTGYSLAADQSAVTVGTVTTLTNWKTIGMAKNVARSNFQFFMFDTSGVLATGKSITATRAIDGADFAACANSASENGAGGGGYKINLADTDLNGDSILFSFAASGCRTSTFIVETTDLS